MAAAKIQVLNLMWGTLAMASRSLLAYHASEVSRDVETVSRHAAALYALVYEHFGDTLATDTWSIRHHR